MAHRRTKQEPAAKNKLDEVETELSDALIYLIRLADKLDIDLLAAAQSKIKVNEQKYL